MLLMVMLSLCLAMSEQLRRPGKDDRPWRSEASAGQFDEDACSRMKARGDEP
jgi:hypothetical protein